MSNDLIPQFEAVMQDMIDNVDLRATCDYYAMAALRDKLEESFPDMSMGAAGDIAASITIDIDNRYVNEDIAKIVELFCEMIVSIVTTMSIDGWSFDAICKSAHKMSLELEY